MDEKWYWIELIGFDRDQKDYGVKQFLTRIPQEISGVSLLLYSIDFINLYEGFQADKPLGRSVCSYGGHPFNAEREIQSWTCGDLKGLIDTLHENDVKVYFSVFDLYGYETETGERGESPFAKEHPELCAFCSEKYTSKHFLLIMKRFADGRAYRDFFIDKLSRLLKDYGFDGFHLADGLSSTRLCIQSGDFSDDIVEQYLAASGERLPDDLRGPCDKSKSAHLARYRFIMQNQRCQFTCFVADWFADYYKRLSNAIVPDGKRLIVNMAWACDPFEALFRYGIDYRKLYVDGIYAMMIEDVGPTMPLLSDVGLGGFHVPVEDRKYYSHTLFLSQLSVKAHLPSVRQFNMTPLGDTQEDWNLIDSAPYEVHKMIVRRKNTWMTTKEGLKRASEGAVYCLSDGISKEKWDAIAQWETFAELPAVTGMMGFTAVWEPCVVYGELKRFIDQRAPSGKHLTEALYLAGIPVLSTVDADELPACGTPVIAANAELYSPETIEKLEKFTAAPLIVIGYANPLKRMPDARIIESEEGIKFFAFNCPQIKNVDENLNIFPKAADVSFRDVHGGIWTAPLRRQMPSRRFLKKVRKCLETLGIYPTVSNGADCRLATYMTGKNQCVILVSNDSFCANDIEIRFTNSVKTVRSLNKPVWYRVPHKENMITIRTNNRAMEVLEVTW